MKRILATALLSTVAFGFAAEAMATEWNVSVWGKRRAFTEHIHKLADLVSEKTGGGFTMNISYGGLSKNRENLDGISIGAFEMAQFCAAYHPDKNPTLMVLDLPFIGVQTLRQEGALDEALYKHPAVVQDLARWNATILMASPLPQYNLAGVGEPPKTLEDFDGLRVRATGGMGNAFEKIGSVPTSVTSAEAYNALESGVVDAVAFAPHAHMSFRTTDIAKWWTTNLNPGSVNCPVVVNNDALAALSDEEREALMSSVPEAMEAYYDAYDVVYEKWGPLLKEKGIEEITLSDDVIGAIKEAAAPVRDEWIKANAGAGLPAQELYDFTLKTVEETKDM
ncbi:MAG: C4-dicarboxylate TRAP transporter substrate-binding protein [Zhengella sp.]|uniref:C4-dicarboxylate TRAP transporter substrate-binding protein n=1 Tax=Zhengella sp. TaxID=2282762 RepID=UPI001DE05DC1|nr:C4-dicarboxylate TRAP transporter substrate-binding protein [Notoacmeibacter sp.]MCC0025879.1 C4-dicarboxylate TRAP transporter substrate-binding protein [Brucellaceae bacterium]